MNEHNWLRAAANSGLSVRQWATRALDDKAEIHSADSRLLDDLSFKNHGNAVSPYPFQTVALRHWIGLTQSDAAKVVEMSPSAYRNCEADDGKVLMEVEVWNKAITRIVGLIGKQDYETLPNSFCRGIRGLTGLNYRELNSISNLSQSYWTTRLRFKHPPTPIELNSVKEILKILIKKIDAKFKKGHVAEGRAMLQTVLFLAYHTQMVRTAKNDNIESVMHVRKHPKYDNASLLDEQKHVAQIECSTPKPTPVNRANLFAITVEALAKRGYHFSEDHPDIQFIYET